MIFTDWFEPGFLAGGPIRSIVNLSTTLQDDFDIFILTSDRDFGMLQPYTDVRSNEWKIYSDNIKVCYLSRSSTSLNNLKHKMDEIDPDIIYLNSMWSIKFTLLPLFIARNSTNIKRILAPRGMLHEGALKYKRFKKKISLSLMKWFGLFDEVLFHATDIKEKEDIQGYFEKNQVEVISNFPTSIKNEFVPLKKSVGKLKLIYISRICKKKNLLYLLESLTAITISHEIIVNVFGPVEDETYFDKCLKVVKRFDKRIKFNFFGVLDNPQVSKEIENHHFFILPTFGENFGHAIFESFATGRPAIISDQTPWRDLQKHKLGFDISLSDPSAFVKAIEYAANMDQKEYDEWCEASLDYAKKYNEQSNLKEKYLELFN